MTKPYDQYNHRVWISPEHYRIHEGESFVGGYFWSESTALLADNASGVILVQPGAGVHMIATVAVGGNSELHLYKGVTGTTTGTSLETFNKNGYSNKVSAMVLHWGTTALLAATGTAFPPKLLPGGVAAGGVGHVGPVGAAGLGYDTEFLLRDDTAYALQIINRSDSSMPASVTLEWYEPGASS